jgi:hypothetical protein
MTLTLRAPVMCAAVLAGVLATVPSEAQTAQHDPAGPKSGMGGKMMADRQTMMADMKAAQQKLDELVAAMNLATGSEKVDRIAAVVTELVAQHREMCRRMMSGDMMTQKPMTQPSPAPIAPPPPAATGKPEDEHVGHHPKP